MKKAIIGMHIGEFGWEILRFAPHLLWSKIKKYNNQVKLIICTRSDRFDLYGVNGDIFVPLEIDGDYTKLNADCFRLNGFPDIEYHKLMGSLHKKFSKKYKIVEQICPVIQGKRYTEKEQYSRHEMLYKFQPREENKRVIDNVIPKNKPLISLASRLRKQGRKRNWPHWEKFYNLISSDLFFQGFNFVICGKPPEYIPDKKNRFYDVNKISQNDNTSLIGYTIEILKRSVLTVGSQSGIPNLSNLIKTPTLQWGNEQYAHERKYNVKKTRTTFIEDIKFECDPQIIIETMKRILTQRRR